MGAGTLMAGFDYVKIGGIGTQLTRDWGRRDVGLITNPNFATNGLSNFIISPNVHSAITTPGGLIVSGPLRGHRFGPGGTISKYDFGQVFGSTMIGGDGANQNENLLALLGTPTEDVNALASAQVRRQRACAIVRRAVRRKVDRRRRQSQEARDRGNLVIQRDNAFLPQSVRDLMIADNLQTITIGRVSNDTGKIQLDRDDKTYEAVGGVTAHFGEWTADAYAPISARNSYDLDFGPNNRKQNEYLPRRSTPSSIRRPARSSAARERPAASRSTCSATGRETLNPYVNGTARFRLVTTQSVAAANLRGTPFSTWAGPVALAVGVEDRRDQRRRHLRRRSRSGSTPTARSAAGSSATSFPSTA